jgi:hypothetical protein
MVDEDDAMAHCCAECGEEGGVVSLKACMSCKLVKYCNAKCQRNHWAKHKKECKRRATEIRDEALFKDPPPKEDCPICFLPMPKNLISCVSLPPATIESVPIYDFSIVNEELAKKHMEVYYSCCGKIICGGCAYSFSAAGNIGKCPFCNSDRGNKTEEESNEDLMKRVAANDAASISVMGNYYYRGRESIQQDRTRAMKFYARAADLGSSHAQFRLGDIYDDWGDLKKSKFHLEAAAMAGHELARFNLGLLEGKVGNVDRGFKHLRIAASAGHFAAMHTLITFVEKGLVSRESIDSTLEAYNNSCVEMRSEARDNYIRAIIEGIL